MMVFESGFSGLGGWVGSFRFLALLGMTSDASEVKV